MRLNYDAATDSLYIHLTDTPAVDSDEVSMVSCRITLQMERWSALMCNTPASRLTYTGWR